MVALIQTPVVALVQTPRGCPLPGIRYIEKRRGKPPVVALAQTPVVALAQTPVVALAQTPVVALAQTPVVALVQTPVVARKSPQLLLLWVIEWDFSWQHFPVWLNFLNVHGRLLCCLCG